MRVTLHDVSMGRRGEALPNTSLEFHSGEALFMIAETEQRPTVLGLIASGRMRPATGRVTIDGHVNAKALRRRIALVDAQIVSDPPPNVSLSGIVAEELMFAGLPATELHSRRWLNQQGFADLASTPMGDVPAAARVRILCELAALRQGVDGLVLVRPDRHGGSPDSWWRIAREFADRGCAVLVIIGGSAALALERMPELDARNASGPIQPLVLDAFAGQSDAELDADAGVDADADADIDEVADDAPDVDEVDAGDELAELAGTDTPHPEPAAEDGATESDSAAAPLSDTVARSTEEDEAGL